MGKETDNLIALANAVSRTLPGREMDMLLTIGERKTMALLCMALADLGVDAVSFTGSQVGIITDNVHGKAKILEVKGDRVRDALADGQGVRGRRLPGRVDREGDHHPRPGRRPTSPRWRSPPPSGPTSCEIYTDVTGVFSADPRIVPQARKLARVHFDEMLEMAAAGGRVLALRSVEFARNHNVALHVRSSFTWEPGTWVTNEEPSMEDPIISGVIHDVSRGQGHGDAPCRTGPASPPPCSSRWPASNINVDMIVQNTSEGRHDRHLLHRAQGRHGRGREGRQPTSRPRSGPAA